MIADRDGLDPEDTIKFNDRDIKNDDLTLKEIGVENNSIFRWTKKKVSYNYVWKFFNKMTLPLLSVGILFGAGHYVSVKFLHLFSHLVKYTSEASKVLSSSSEASA